MGLPKKKKTADHSKQSPPKLLRTSEFRVPFLWGPQKTDPRSEILPRGSCNHPWMSELRPCSSQVQLWFRMELFFATEQPRTLYPLSFPRGREFVLDECAPVEGDTFKFGYIHWDKFQNFFNFPLKLKISGQVISNKVQTYRTGKLTADDSIPFHLKSCN